MWPTAKALRSARFLFPARNRSPPWPERRICQAAGRCLSSETLTARARRARFQHPLGLAYHDGRLFVADTYNHKIKTIDVATGEVKTALGNGKRGTASIRRSLRSRADFPWPPASCISPTRITTRSRSADMATGRVTTLQIEGLSPPRAASADEVEKEEKTPASSVKVEAQTVAAGDSLKIEFSFKLPDGFKLNEAAPTSCRLRTSSSTDVIAPAELSKHHRAELGNHKAMVTLPLTHKSGKAVFDISLSFTYCRDGVGGICKLGSGHWTVPIEFAADAKRSDVNLTASARLSAD